MSWIDTILRRSAPVQAAAKAPAPIQVTRPAQDRLASDMRKFRAALQAAEQRSNPSRQQLHIEYNKLITDAHLSACMMQRLEGVLSKPIEIVNDAGDVQSEVLDIFRAPWLRETLRHIVESRAYGFTLIQYPGLEADGWPMVPMLVPRTNVRPEMGIVGEYGTDLTGISFLEEPYLTWCLPIGNPLDLGYLYKAAAPVIWKKHAQSTWAALLDILGVPIRIGQTQVRDPELLANMTAMLSDMGRSAWAVLDTEDKFNLVEGGKTNADAFASLSAFCNEELSKLTLGQTMTSENGASRSQGEVHERVLDQIIASDARLCEDVINRELFPRLAAMGCPIGEYKFRFASVERIDMPTRFGMVRDMPAYLRVDPDYVTETFGIPVVAVDTPAPDGGQAVGKPEAGQ